MKNLHFYFILLLIPFISQAQDTVKRSIPLLKESPKIDSLIKSVVSLPVNLKGLNKDSCILLGLFKNKNDVGFVTEVNASNHKQVIFDLTNFSINKKCGYFEFDGYLIFVYGDKFMNDFFTITNSKKEFTFIKPTTKETASEINHLMSWALFYKNEVFSWGVH